MPSYSAKVTEQGMIPIPPEMQQSLAIKPGEEVEFFVTAEGQVHFHVLREHFDAFEGIRAVPPISVREMDDAIGDYLASKDERILASSPSRAKPAAE